MLNLNEKTDLDKILDMQQMNTFLLLYLEENEMITEYFTWIEAKMARLNYQTPEKHRNPEESRKPRGIK